MSVGLNSDLCWHLGDLSNFNFENGMSLISVRVVRKDNLLLIVRELNANLEK